MTETILITEKKQSSPKPDTADESAPNAQYCFLFRGRLGCFYLREKRWIIIKKKRNPFSTPIGVRLLPAQGWDGLTQQFIWFRVPEFYLAQRECDDLNLYAATLHLGRSMGGFPLFPLAMLPLPHLTKNKQNEINRSREGMKSLKLNESPHRRVSLHPL